MHVRPLGGRFRGHVSEARFMVKGENIVNISEWPERARFSVFTRYPPSSLSNSRRQTLSIHSSIEAGIEVTWPKVVRHKMELRIIGVNFLGVIM